MLEYLFTDGHANTLYLTGIQSFFLQQCVVASKQTRQPFSALLQLFYSSNLIKELVFGDRIDVQPVSGVELRDAREEFNAALINVLYCSKQTFCRIIASRFSNCS
jgi:hypothetical protein